VRQKYQFDLPSFSGPLDLLLHLIDRQELDITTLSLVAVTAQYLAQIEKMKEDRVAQLIDFLVVAARLVQIKSRALLPQNPVALEEEEFEEDPAEALLRQLRAYKQFKEAAQWLEEREKAGLRTYLRLAPPPRLENRLDMSGVNVESLLAAVRAALERATERDDSVSIVQPRRLTIEAQIAQVRRRINGASASTSTIC
jgi:segregation and condensation protein A